MVYIPGQVLHSLTALVLKGHRVPCAHVHVPPQRDGDDRSAWLCRYASLNSDGYVVRMLQYSTRQASKALQVELPANTHKPNFEDSCTPYISSNRHHGLVAAGSTESKSREGQGSGFSLRRLWNRAEPCTFNAPEGI